LNCEGVQRGNAIALKHKLATCQKSYLLGLSVRQWCRLHHRYTRCAVLDPDDDNSLSSCCCCR